MLTRNSKRNDSESELSSDLTTMTDNPTLSWEAMQDGNVFYRRQQHYSVRGKFPALDDHLVAGCRYAGPLGQFLPYLATLGLMPLLAFMRDSSKAIAIGLATPLYAKAQVQIYSPAGESMLMCSVEVLHS
jgi:vacuolar protein sorting-associated protein 16